MSSSDIFLSLPDDVWILIFNHIYIENIAKCSLTSRQNLRRIWGFVVELDGRFFPPKADFTAVVRKYLRGSKRNDYLHRLHSVRITDSNISTSSVNPFPTVALLPRLKKLDLSDCFRLHSGPTDYLSNLTTLTELSLARCLALRDDEALAYWSRFWLRCGAGIKTLNVNSCHGLIASNGLRYLTALSSLKTLDASNINVLPTFWNALLHTPSLTRLELRRVSFESDISLHKITLLRNLTHLNISRAQRVRDETIRSIAKLTNLRYLDLGVMKQAISHELGYVTLSSLTNLTFLNLELSRTVTNATVETLAKHVTKLKTLNLSYCLEVGLDSVMLLSSMKQLTYLNLSQTQASREVDDNVETIASVIGISSVEIEMEPP